MRTYLGLGNSNARDVPENIVNAVAETLRKSDFLKVSEDGKKIGRVSELSKPEEIIEQVDIRTIAASPLEYDINIEDVESFFGQYGKVNSVRLPHHIADKRCFCGTALIEFSAEGDAEKVLKQNLVYSGTKLELKPKKVFDAKRTKSMEDLQKSHSSTGSNHKNNASTNTNYTKGLIVAFTLKRRSIGGPVGCNHKPDPTNNNGHVSMTEKELKSKENAIEESKHKVSEDVVGGYKNPLKNIEKGNGEKIEEKITKESEQKDSENAIHVTGKNSPEVVCQESTEESGSWRKKALLLSTRKRTL
ncbi:hypothetical protein L1049_005210 [Liquidambar formosana]|uniref:RRM domain-containing protein n=1 Tax=Liquidambar formosana TaxID=63359 RepID=A0AAP0WZ24_LIQFO